MRRPSCREMRYSSPVRSIVLIFDGGDARPRLHSSSGWDRPHLLAGMPAEHAACRDALLPASQVEVYAEAFPEQVDLEEEGPDGQCACEWTGQGIRRRSVDAAHVVPARRARLDRNEVWLRR